MNKQQAQNTYKNGQPATGKLGFLLGIGLILFITALTINYVSHRTLSIPNTGSSIQAQSVPEAGVQGVADYINAHKSNSSAQAVPEAAVQSVTDYLSAHSDYQAQAVPEAAVQGVTDYLQAHNNTSKAQSVPEAAVQGVLDYLKAHGFK